MKIEVHGRQAKLYLGGSANPSLVVDGLKGEDLQGSIALWGYLGEEAYFSNFRISNATAEPLWNSGEAAGTWNVTCATDAGRFTGTLKLVRQDSTLVGIWSGALGPDQSVSGKWRNGYVELTFSGTWQEQPGTVAALLAGWIDVDSATGRMKVEGRADGRRNGTNFYPTCRAATVYECRSLRWRSRMKKKSNRFLSQDQISLGALALLVFLLALGGVKVSQAMGIHLTQKSASLERNTK